MTLPLEVTPGAAWFTRWEAELGDAQRAALELLREHAARGYLVGGAVRDLLLGRPTRDLDIVLLEPVKPLGETLARALGGSLTCHESFLTCSLIMNDSSPLDLSQARREHYTAPGALPRVTASDLEHDLYRRDFSVNTLALSLTPPHDLIGVTGAQEDLETRTLRILHEQSFFDDPTRIIRGARLAARLGFTFDIRTMDALQDALRAGAGTSVSPARRRNELLLCLSEPAVVPVVTELNTLGVLEAFYGLSDTPLLTDLDTLRRAEPVPLESYLLALLLPLSEQAATTFITRFGFPQRLLSARKRALQKEPAKTAAEGVLTRLLYPEGAPSYPPVRGADVLSLGLPAGPKVGAVLRELERARVSGEVASFADELELARRLVSQTLQEQT